MLRRVTLLAVAIAIAAPLHAAQDEAAARRLLAQAERLEAAGDLAGAIRELRLLREQFPRTPATPDAMLHEATLQRRLGDADAARQVAQELVSGTPRSGAAAGAMVLLAELDLARASSRDALDRVRTQLARVPLLYGSEEFPSLPARTAARILAGSVSLRLGEVERATGILLAAAEDESPNQFTPASRVALASSLIAGGRWPSAAWWLGRVGGDHGGDPETRATARRLLESLERFEVRAPRGLAPWRASRTLSVPGLDLGRQLSLAASEDGRILVADDKTGVRELGREGGGIGSTNGVDVQAVVFDLDGAAWMVLPGGLAEIGGGRRLTLSQPDDPSKPLDRIGDAAPDAVGGWFVLDTRKDRILRYDRDGRSLGAVEVGTREPIAIASDGRGRLYVLDRKAGTVIRRAEGAAAVLVRGQWRDARALDVDRYGRIVVLDEDGARVHLYAEDGRSLGAFGPSLAGGATLAKPSAVAIDGAGRLVVADRKAQTVWVVE